MIRLIGTILFLTGAALGLAAVIGLVNTIFGLSLELSIGQSDIGIPSGWETAAALGILGLMFAGLGRLLDRHVQVLAALRSNRLLLISVVVAVIALPIAGYFGLRSVDGGAAGSAVDADRGAELARLLDSGQVQTGDFPGLMHRAVRRGSTRALQVLVKRKQSGHLTHLFGESGYTLLEAAILWGKPDAVRLLARAGSNVNRKNKHGHTPLHHALLYRERGAADRIAVVRILRAAGASPTARDLRGQSPLDIARERSWKQVEAELRR